MRILSSLSLLLVAFIAGCSEQIPSAPESPGTDDAIVRSDGFLVRTYDATAGRKNGKVTNARPAKMSICHYDADAGAFKLISVGAPAYNAHVRHGDGVPGGEVPTQEGFTFDEACRPITIAPFTCTTEIGPFTDPYTGEQHAATAITITIRITDPDYLPVTGPGVASDHASGVLILPPDNLIVENGVGVGVKVIGVQTDPTVMVNFTGFAVGPNLPDNEPLMPGGEVFCGPYTIPASEPI